MKIDSNSSLVPAPFTPSFERNAVTQAAFDRVLPRATALAATELLRVTIDVPSAITAARAATRRAQTMSAEIAMLPGVPHNLLELIDETSTALVHAQSLYAVQSPEENNFAELVRECERLRGALLLDLAALVSRNAVDAVTVERIKDGSGFNDLAQDLVDIDVAITAARNKLGERLWITTDEQAYFRGRASALREANERRARNDLGDRQRIETRQRVYTLFVREYDQLRRAISFLRWNHGDADTIAPSLFTKGRRARLDEEPAPPVDNKPARPVIDTDPTRPVPQDDPFAKS
ncbi:MAG: hypothetical protein U0269_25080 [Polyangiales bacterium]